MATIIANSARIKIRWPQQYQVPVGGFYNVYSNDGAGGAIDYENPLNVVNVDAWPGRDGQGNGVGWGIGIVGYGRWGYGAGWLEFTTEELLDGTWSFAVVGYDVAGNRVTPATVTPSATAAGEPTVPKNLLTDSYDSGNNRLTVSWTKSTDDED